MKDKGYMKKYGNNKKTRKRASSEVPKSRNKVDKVGENSMQLISPQTNLLNAWNILKP